MLNNEQIKNINEAGKVVFATCDESFKPHCVWVMPSRVEKDRIILSNIQMETSIKNVKDNKNCFINVYFPEKDDMQYKIDGVAEVFESGKLFEDIKNYEESENLPPELKVNSIIVVSIKNVVETIG